MYITECLLSNFCRPGEVKIELPKGQEKGWHVIIGDNASGKSSLLKGLAIVLVNQPEFLALNIKSTDLVASKAEVSYVVLDGAYNDELDYPGSHIKEDAQQDEQLKSIIGVASFSCDEGKFCFSLPLFCQRQSKEYKSRLASRLDGYLIKVHKIPDVEHISIEEVEDSVLTYCAGWFSASYGPLRRLSGGSSQWESLANTAPRAAAHITLFHESAALTDVMDWLKDLDRRQLKEQSRQQPGDPEPESARIFNGVRHFINHSELLPGGVQFIEVNLDGVPVFRDANGHEVTVTQLSDGFRSILSVAFDLVRQLIRVYGLDKVFPPGKSDITNFPLPGVVLIDEVDAHLHPTWQTRIGQWFTKHFPEMQFIVTTHSPLICRACEHGTIWRLPPPGSEGGIEQITGAEKDRLVYGNVLDAYETQAFGAHMSRGEEGRHAQKEYLDLYYKRLYNVPMNEEEQARLEQLEAVFHSHVAIDED